MGGYYVMRFLLLPLLGVLKGGRRRGGEGGGWLRESGVVKNQWRSNQTRYEELVVECGDFFLGGKDKTDLKGFWLLTSERGGKKGEKEERKKKRETRYNRILYPSPPLGSLSTSKPPV